MFFLKRLFLDFGFGFFTTNGDSPKIRDLEIPANVLISKSAKPMFKMKSNFSFQKTTQISVTVATSMAIAFSPLAARSQQNGGRPMQVRGNTSQLDVSGADGTDARHGSPNYPSGSRPGGSGRNGDDGGDATTSTAGVNSGDGVYEVRQPELNRGFFEITGQIRPSQQNQLRPIAPIQVEIGNTTGTLNLDLTGGNGGNGGIGGTPEGGGHGSDGQDAHAMHMGNGMWIETQQATDGDDGGHAGRVGQGTSGSRSGDGGRGVLRVPKGQTHLVALFQWQTNAGRPGDVGRHGQPQPGGHGGRGGDSFSGSATYQSGTQTRYRTAYRTGTNGQQESYQESYEEPVYSTTTKHMSGGSNGSNGSSSPSISHYPSLRAGERGSDGSFVVQEIDQNGNVFREYPSGFNIEIFDYEATDDDGTGMFEPGRRGKITKIRVKNTGGMPTPELPVYVLLTDSKYVLADPIRIPLPRLQPGQDVVIEGPFPFTVNNLDYIPRGKAFADIGRADAATYITMMTESPDAAEKFAKSREQVDGRFSNDGHYEPLTVRYPISFSPLITLRSLIPGKIVEVVFEVHNDSDRDFGATSDWGREVRALLDIDEGSQLDPSMLEFIGPNGARVSANETLITAIQSLRKKGTVDSQGRKLDRALVRAFVKLSPEADQRTYQNVQLQVKVALSDGPGATSFKPIQSRAVEDMTVTEVATPDDDNTKQWLLVVNNETTDEEIKAWKKKALIAGRDLTIWDLSLYGHIDLAERLKQGHTIMEHFKQGVMIVLNNDFNPGTGEVRAEDLALQEILVQARTQFGMNVLVVGDTQEGARHAIERMTTPVMTPHENDVVNGFGEFFKQIEKRVASSRPLEGLGDIESEDRWVIPLSDIFNLNKEGDVLKIFSLVFDQVNVSKRAFFGVPKESRLKKSAQSAIDRLNVQRPEFNYYAVYRYEPKTESGQSVEDAGWLARTFGNWDIGSVEIRRGPDYRSGSVVALEVDPSDFKREEYINGDDVERALLLADSFEQNLRDLKRAINRMIYDERARYDVESDKSLSVDGYYGDQAGRLGVAHELAVSLGITERELDLTVKSQVKNLVDVILTKLAEEQTLYRNAFFKNGLSTADVKRELVSLNALVEKFFGFLESFTLSQPQHSELRDDLLRMLAGLALFEESESTLYRWFTFTRNQAVSHVSREQRMRLQVSLFGNANDSTGLGKANHERFVKIYKELKAESKALAKRSKTARKDVVRRMVMKASLDKKVSTGFQVGQEHSRRVIRGSEADQMLARRNESVARREAYRASVEEARRDLQLSPADQEHLQRISTALSSGPRPGTSAVLAATQPAHVAIDGDQVLDPKTKQICELALKRGNVDFVNRALRAQNRE